MAVESVNGKTGEVKDIAEVSPTTGKLLEAQVPESVVNSSAASDGQVPIANGKGGYEWSPLPEILVDSFPGTDWEKLKAAWEQATTAGQGVVRLAPREYSLTPAASENLVIPTGLTGWVRLRGSGIGNTIVKLSTTCKTLLKAEAGEGTTLQYFAVEDLTLDANKQVIANGSCLLKAYGFKYNLEYFAIRNIDIINYGELSATAGRAIALTVAREDAFGATQNLIRHGLIENVRIGRTGGGGDTGLLITGYYNGEEQGVEAYEEATVPVANVFIDDITVRNYWWSSGQKEATEVGNGQSGALQIGGGAACGKIVLDNIYGYGGGDVGIEVDSCYELDASNIHIENCLNEAFLITAQPGGLPNPERQTINVTNLTCVRSESRWATMQGLRMWGVHGAKYGTCNITNFTFKHTAPEFQTPTGAFTNPTNQPIAIQCDFRRVSIQNANISYSGLELVSSESGQNQEPRGITIRQEGGTGIVEIDGATLEIDGKANSGTFTGCALVAAAVNIQGASRLGLDIRSVSVRSNIKSEGTFKVRLRDVEVQTGQTVVDNWKEPSLNLAYVLRTGSRTGLTQSTINKKLECTVNPAERRIFRAPLVGAGAAANQIGSAMDGAIYLQGTTPATSITGWELIAVAKMNEAKGNEIRAILSDNGTNTSLRIEEVVANTAPVVLVTENLTERIKTATTVGLRIILQGNTVYADYFSTGTIPTLKTESAKRVITTLTTTAQKANFGAESFPGGLGWGWTPGETSATLGEILYNRMLVISGNIDRLKEIGDFEPVTRHQGIVFTGNTAEGARIEGILHCRGWNRLAVVGKESNEDISFSAGSGNEALKRQISLTDSYLAKPPAPAVIAVGASPFTYINEDMVPEDVVIYGGELSGTAPVELSHNAGETFTEVGSLTTGENLVLKLAPGDQVKTTYASGKAPTMSKIPIIT